MYFALGLGSLLTFKEVEVTLNVALSWEISRRQEPQIVKIETIKLCTVRIIFIELWGTTYKD